ncbi:MAG: tail length tape measure protein, partial [Microcoleaceae cyanobacterium]
MLKQNITKISILIAVSAGALLLGVFLPQLTSSNKISQNAIQNQKLNPELDVTNFVSFPPQQRRSKLEAAIKIGKSLNTSRASYMLATDLIEQGEAESAIAQLKDLEGEYAALAPYIILKRA